MICSDKRNIRQSIRAKIATLSAEDKATLSSQIFNKIAYLKEIKQASIVALFVSLADEPQTSNFINQLLSRQIKVVVPRIEGEEMEFYDISEGIATGAFGIMEPTSKEPIDPSKIDVMIVPGVAFTQQGARLGRGKGFYDKYLSHSGFRARTIGVCYPCQIVETLPTEEHDKVLDCVISI